MGEYNFNISFSLNQAQEKALDSILAKVNCFGYTRDEVVEHIVTRGLYEFRENECNDELVQAIIQSIMDYESSHRF